MQNAKQARMDNAASGEPTNGSALAAFLAAGIGAAAMGLVLVLNETGIFAAPTIYGPSGGVSGRTTFAVVAWLVAWAVLHFRWKDRQLEPRRIALGAFVLIAFGILVTFPPTWGLM